VQVHLWLVVLQEAVYLERDELQSGHALRVKIEQLIPLEDLHKGPKD
jgi:hypothetical protein